MSFRYLVHSSLRARAVLIVTMLATVASGLIDLDHPLFKFFYGDVYVPLYAAAYALTGFYIISALYRSFKARNYESALLLVSASILLLKNAPIGEAILGKGIVTLGDWIMGVPNAAGNMAILIGFAIGVIILSLRTLLGMERGFLGGSK